MNDQTIIKAIKEAAQQRVPDADWVIRSRNTLMHEIAAGAQISSQGAPEPRRSLLARIWTVKSASAVFTVLLTVVTSTAVVQSSNAYPHQKLYVVKEIKRDLKVGLASNETKKIATEFEIVGERAHEISFLVSLPEENEETVAASTDHLRNAVASLRDDAESVHDRLATLETVDHIETAKKVSQDSDKVAAQLNTIASSAPDVALDVIDTKHKVQKTGIVALSVAAEHVGEGEEARQLVKELVEEKMASIAGEAEGLKSSLASAEIEIEDVEERIAEARSHLSEGDFVEAVGKVNAALELLTSTEKALLVDNEGKIYDPAREDVGEVKGVEVTREDLVEEVAAEEELTEEEPVEAAEESETGDVSNQEAPQEVTQESSEEVEVEQSEQEVQNSEEESENSLILEENEEDIEFTIGA